MDDLVVSLRPEVAQQAEVVLHVFKHIHEQEEIKVRILLLSDIGQLELKPFARQALRPRKRLGRDVIPPTAASSMQSLMNQPQHFSGSTPHIADRGGCELVASDHLKDVLRLPRGFVGMPQWVLDEVFATEVLVSNHCGCSLASLTSARRRAAPRVRSITTRWGPAAATARVASTEALPTTSTSACARSVSTSVTMGLSRRSSVPALKARPTTPILRFRVASTASTARRTCPSFDGRMAASSGTGTSAVRAAYTRARRSFGRQEPPKAKPGRRYASETFSFRSIRKIRMASCASAPSAAHTSPISLAKHTLRAWNALDMYLTTSAVVTVVWTKAASTSPYSERSTAAVPASTHPTRVNGGRAKSRIAEPSRMNSGLTATRTEGPSSRPAPARIAGTSTRSVVPGSTVLRSTTL